jgi:hypothetical protein
MFVSTIVSESALLIRLRNVFVCYVHILASMDSLIGQNSKGRHFRMLDPDTFTHQSVSITCKMSLSKYVDHCRFYSNRVLQ